MKYIVTDIIYDTNDTDGLPTSIEMEFPDDTYSEELPDLISEMISNITGFCHKGFGFSVLKTKNIIEKGFDYRYQDIERILGNVCEIHEFGNNTIGENFIVAKHSMIDETSSFVLTGTTSNDYIYTCVYTDYKQS